MVRKRTKRPKRIVPIEFHKTKNSDLVRMDGVNFLVPVKARLSLVRQWWDGYRKAKPKAADRLMFVYAFHYHLRLLFPKESGILIAYPSSLVNLAREEYYTSRRYRALCNQVLKRDDNRCRVCNRPGPLQVHHRNYSYWGNESEDELTTLCEDCHGKVHGFVQLANNGLFYVWTKPVGANRMVPWGYTDSIRLAREEADKWWQN